MYIYNYVDHLGNVRISYYKNSAGALTILEENNYYPFGLKQQGYNAGNTANANYAYKYNGKELQENGLIDYGWRNYMPELGKWNAIDQLAENYHSSSPYAYVLNNPVMLTDPDGRKVAPIDQFDCNVPSGGLMAYYATGGHSTYGSLENYLGYQNPFKTMMSGGGDESGGSTGNSSAVINRMLSLGGSWTNQGYGFSSNDNIAIDYSGNYLSLNTQLDGWINIPEVALTGKKSMWGLQIQSHFNSFMDNYNTVSSFNYWKSLSNMSNYQAKTDFAFGSTLGLASEISENLIKNGKMIKTTNIFTTYNLYRVNGTLNGNKYISGMKFLNRAKTVSTVSSKISKGISYAGLAISGAQFLETRHPGYISRGIVGFWAGKIPWVGPAVALSIDQTDVDYWNIWTMTAKINGESTYHYLHPESYYENNFE